MPSRTAIAALFLSIAATPSMGQSILGYGIMSCAEVVSVAQRQPYRDHLVAWTGGFLSGANAMLIGREQQFVDLSSLKNVDIVIGHIVARCSANPNQQLAEAITQIALSLPMRSFKPER